MEKIWPTTFHLGNSIRRSLRYDELGRGWGQPLWPFSFHSFHGFLRPNEDVPALPKSVWLHQMQCLEIWFGWECKDLPSRWELIERRMTSLLFMGKCAGAEISRKQQHAGVEAHNHHDHYAFTKWMRLPGYKAMRDVASAMFGVHGCSIASEFFFGSAIGDPLHKIEHYIAVFWILAPLDMFKVSSIIQKWLMSWILQFDSWCRVAFIPAGIHCAWGLRNELLRRVSWKALRALCCRNMSEPIKR